MDLVLKGRNFRITEQARKAVEHKLAKLSRLDPRVAWMDVEIEERNPRVQGSHLIQITCQSGRHTFRAEGAGNNVDSALDQVVERLERQISDDRGRWRTRLFARKNRLQSTRTSAKEARRSE